MNKQYYADYHFHTECSPDSLELLEKHIESARERGINELCVTDHWDLVDELRPTVHPKIEQWHEIYIRNFDKISSEKIKLNFGVEVAEGFTNLAITQKTLTAYPFDFVLGSVHCSGAKNEDVTEGENGEAVNHGKGTGLSVNLKNSKNLQDRKLILEDYFEELLLQSSHTYFDSLSHINYPFRYLNPADGLLITDYMEQVTAVLENLIKNQKSMELNTTRDKNVGMWTPILRRYQELGGKYITIGSDAHVANHIGLGVHEGVELLKSLGFSTYATYTKRTLVEVPIL